jgi:MoaA/NifB/PqqE/SkfB family radical SAM enzyme
VCSSDLANHDGRCLSALSKIFFNIAARIEGRGSPVVSTPLGAEGLEVEDGRELLLAELDRFPAAVLRALDDAALRLHLGHHARAYARARDWRVVGETTRRVLAGEAVDFRARTSIEAHLPPRAPGKPLTLLFLVNRGCNLCCSFCTLWDTPANVPLDRAVALLDEAVAIGTRTVVLTGGEPLLHPDLPAIVRAAKARGLAVNLTTNGTLHDRHHDALVSAGEDSLSFSIDGLPDTHDRLRGQPRAHARTWAALERVVREGQVGASVYFTVTRQNVRELVEVHEQVRRLGAGFDFWPVNDAPDAYLQGPEDRQAWLDALAVLARRDGEVARKAHYYAEALRYHAGGIGPVRCLGLVDQYGVTYTGDLLPCCVWGGEGLVVGNVFRTPLRELWVSPAVQAARERLWGAGCTAGCYNHSLYELTESTGRSHRLE